MARLDRRLPKNEKKFKDIRIVSIRFSFRLDKIDNVRSSILPKKNLEEILRKSENDFHIN